MKNSTARAAFVSTNSISQGETVTRLWKNIFAAGNHIDFAYRTFIWDNESIQKAHVHCVIVGFSSAQNDKLKIIFDADKKFVASNINAYLLDAPDILVESHSKPLCNVPPMMSKKTVFVTKKFTSGVLLKGSCDFRRMKLYLNADVEFEGPYASDEKLLVYQTGIPTMAMTLLFSKDEIAKFTEGWPFYSRKYYSTKLFATKYQFVFVSTISLANLGVYKHKHADFFLNMGLLEFPMYLPENETKYATNGIYANGFSNTHESFAKLRKNFNYINDSYVEQYLEIHLTKIVRNIKADQIFLILGNEERYLVNKTPAEQRFKLFNSLIHDLSAKERFKTINISDYIDGPNDVINH